MRRLEPIMTAVVVCLVARAAHAEGSGVLTGVVVDAATKRPIPDAVVTASTPAMQGESTVLTDRSGTYRVPNLPPGRYTLRVEADAHKPTTRPSILLRLDVTLRVDAELMPETLRAQEVRVVAKVPTVDVGSTRTGRIVDQDFLARLPLHAPGDKDAGVRSFEALASLAPGAVVDQYGVSIAGATSPENAFRIDGLSVADPGYGILGTPLTVAFVKEVSVVTGGFMPEYGKAMGGVVDAVTKSGSNAFYGQVFVNETPGALEGRRALVRSAAYAIVTQPSLGDAREVGADLGGPILKDRLWFYVGLDAALTTDRLERNVQRFVYVRDKAHPGGFVQALDASGYPITAPVTCSAADASSASGCPKGAPASPVFLATERSLQYIGKLTWKLAPSHTLTLSTFGTPTRSGGDGTYAMDATGHPLGLDPSHPGQLWGSYGALGSQIVADAFDTSLAYAGSSDDKHQLVDVRLGWHHQHRGTHAADGSGPDQTLDPTTLAGTPQVQFRRDSPAVHSLTDFEHVPGGACRTVPVRSAGTGAFVATPTCPMPTYGAGGPSFLDDAIADGLRARALYTRLFQGAGHHVLKAGVEVGLDLYAHDRAFSGTDVYRETSDGSAWQDFRSYGFLAGPDQPVLLAHYVAHSASTSVGGFLQDSWQVLDEVTLDLGLRYDAQFLRGDAGLGLALPNEWSPRVGILYDPTRHGRSKIFASFARYYEAVPLDLADRAMPNEPSLVSLHDAGQCQPLRAADVRPGGSCTTNAGRLPLGSASDPSRLWGRVGGNREPVDPSLEPESSNEVVVGAEVEIFPDARLGVTYTHRWLDRAIEDMSRDEGSSYFIGNPGYGIGADFPKAQRDYDALTVSLDKAYASGWLLSASYTLSRLYGNYAGLFRPETGQLDPNFTSDFDLKSLLVNQLGPLPGDHTHAVKLHAAKDVALRGGQDLLVGLSYRGISGPPLDAFGSHPLYGPDEAFVVPRGMGGKLHSDGSITPERGDWVHSIDLRVGYSAPLGAARLSVTVDVFNIFDLQAATVVDQTYTNSDVLPCTSGAVPTCVRHADASVAHVPFAKSEVNPNYGRPLAYQDPRQFRFGMKVTF